MALFKRAEWHSGLTYSQTCRQCHTVVTYTDKLLDFRPWYADGFVYCPKCNTPLRHNENYAINAPQAYTGTSTAAFCHECGKKYQDGDKFCSECGTMRR